MAQPTSSDDVTIPRPVTCRLNGFLATQGHASLTAVPIKRPSPPLGRNPPVHYHLRSPRRLKPRRRLDRDARRQGSSAAPPPSIRENTFRCQRCAGAPVASCFALDRHTVVGGRRGRRHGRRVKSSLRFSSGLRFTLFTTAASRISLWSASMSIILGADTSLKPPAVAAPG